MKTRHVKVVFSDGLSAIFLIEFHCMTNIVMQRIKDEAQAKKIRRKVSEWYFIDDEEGQDMQTN